jgi:hypothetical protein
MLKRQGRKEMKKKTILALLLMTGLISVLAIRPAHADITSVAWIKPVQIPSPDPFLGTISVAYIAGSAWMLNIKVYNDAYNGTPPGPLPSVTPMDIRVFNIAVWFDWDLFYNTTVNVGIKHGETHLFTIEGTTESPPTASNLFTHSYSIYVEYEITYKKDGVTVTEDKKWGPYDGVNFAVLSQDQYDAVQTSLDYADFENEVGGYVDDYVDSNSLYIQAEREVVMGDTSYGQGEFSDALLHYNNALSQLTQSWTTYKGIREQYESVILDNQKADLNKKLAEIDAIQANATARLIEANALYNSMMVNSFAFMFFGVGFMFFGIAAIFYARRPKPAQS